MSPDIITPSRVKMTMSFLRREVDEELTDIWIDKLMKIVKPKIPALIRPFAAPFIRRKLDDLIPDEIFNKLEEILLEKALGDQDV